MLHVQWKLLIKANIDRKVARFILVVQRLLNFFTQYSEVSDKEISILTIGCMIPSVS